MRSHKKFGPDRFSRFDVYWIQTNRQTDKQTDKPNLYIDVRSTSLILNLKTNYFSNFFLNNQQIRQNPCQYKKNVHFSDLSPAPPIGFNLTYICPPGEVFDSDWLATPFVLTTCQVCK